MKLSFFGAVRQVTGSMFLLELEEDYRILIDCGTNLEPKSKIEDSDDEYGLFPFEASMVNLVVLTHAHIDHSGQIPNLFQEGFEGQILCTPATKDLAEILLYDAASLNQRKLKSIQKSKNYSRKRRSIATGGLYLNRQVEEAIDNFVPLEHNRKFKITENCSITFIPAGHLLGASHVVFEVRENGNVKTICFSGDIGRKNYPLLCDPQGIPEVDYLICESTYGMRYHEDKQDPKELLKSIIKECCIDIPGRLIIPTFSVGRTQALLYTLNRIYEEDDIEPIKVFTDSPLGKASTKVHEKYTHLLNPHAIAFKKENDMLFDFENLHYVSGTKESEAISSHSEACIIISSSGMIQGGRIEHHVATNLENPYACLLFIGYATEGSLGHKLRHQELKQLTIRGAKKDVLLKIRSTDVFSGHGDLGDLLNFVKSQNPEKLKKVFLVHGELDSMINFKEELSKENYNNVEIPEKNQTFVL
ncbi:metallo-beta-lactamase family protein [Spirosomataceae bacterium TFI 002]|nr:metallo-beta-lactamase family protein [Spirosomataceae bacterium TFI 002]